MTARPGAFSGIANQLPGRSGQKTLFVAGQEFLAEKYLSLTFQRLWFYNAH
jgi:hypothetical protein